jgi:hypothetical protein
MIRLIAAIAASLLARIRRIAARSIDANYGNSRLLRRQKDHGRPRNFPTFKKLTFNAEVVPRTALEAIEFAKGERQGAEASDLAAENSCTSGGQASRPPLSQSFRQHACRSRSIGQEECAQDRRKKEMVQISLR